MTRKSPTDIPLVTVMVAELTINWLVVELNSKSKSAVALKTVSPPAVRVSDKPVPTNDTSPPSYSKTSEVAENSSPEKAKVAGVPLMVAFI